MKEAAEKAAASSQDKSDKSKDKSGDVEDGDAEPMDDDEDLVLVQKAEEFNSGKYSERPV